MVIKFFQKIGFVFDNADPYILAYQHNNMLIFVGVYVDELVLGSQSQNRRDWFKDEFLT